jgi:hypothetical protein
MSWEPRCMPFVLLLLIIAVTAGYYSSYGYSWLLFYYGYFG